MQQNMHFTVTKTITYLPTDCGSMSLIVCYSRGAWMVSVEFSNWTHWRLLMWLRLDRHRMVLPWQQTRYHSVTTKKIEQFPVFVCGFPIFIFRFSNVCIHWRIKGDDSFSLKKTLLVSYWIVSNNKNPFNRLKFKKDSHQRFQLVIKSGFNFKNDYSQ